MVSELSHTGRALADLGAQLTAERARVQQLAERVEACERVLRDIEWDAAGDCPWCHYDEHSGHTSDCALDAALRMGGAR